MCAGPAIAHSKSKQRGYHGDRRAETRSTGAEHPVRDAATWELGGVLTAETRHSIRQE